MILGVGIDVVNISRIEDLLKKFDKKFENKIFTKDEIKTANKLEKDKKIKFYAKRFAAKEAFSKAIGLGIGRGINFIDIEVINDKNGKPDIKLSKSAKLFLKQHFKKLDCRINLSLTDDMPIAQAIVIISKK